ncbi:MAG TPA: hypothetical protein VIL44_09540 [Micromonospora sp.]
MVDDDPARAAGPDSPTVVGTGADPTELIERVRVAAAHDPGVRRAVSELVAELRRAMGKGYG